MRLEELPESQFDKLDKLPLDKVSVKQIKSALKTASIEDTKKLEELLKLKQLLNITDEAIDFLDGVDFSELD